MELIFSAWAIFLAGAAVSLFNGKISAFAKLCAATGSLLSVAGAVSTYFNGNWGSFAMPGPIPGMGISVLLQSLGAFFTVLCGLAGFACSVYSLGLREEGSGRLYFCFNLLLLSLSGITVSGNAFTFLMFWELMTISSFFMVLHDYHNEDTRHSAYVYMVMSQLSAALIMLVFAGFYRATGSMEFSVWGAKSVQYSLAFKNVIFLLSLLGFGIKAGLVPVHIWLPLAHSAAPAQVSGLMSGVMIKMGIYGFLLVIFSFLGQGPAWWGAVVLAAGAVTAVTGVLFAVQENDLKRLLAYSTVENAGIIFLGIGAGSLLNAYGYTLLSIAALSAALFHCLNHSMFKSLLFLSAGAVVHSCGTRSMEKMGGLIKKMPFTAAFFIVGTLAITAVPPLNGFFSEWMTFHALLSLFSIHSAWATLGGLLAVAALALTGGLAAACFAKAAGITFLAMPRSEEAVHAHEASGFEVSAMAMLALGCVAASACGMQIFDLIHESLKYGTRAFFVIAGPDAPLPIPHGNMSIEALWLIVLGSLLCAAAMLMLGKRQVRVVPTWACGMKELTPRMEYSSTAYTKGLRMVFSFMFRPTRRKVSDLSVSEYFPRNITYTTSFRNLVTEKLYAPLSSLALRGSETARRLQSGSVNVYLGYLLAALAVLISILIAGQK